MSYGVYTTATGTHRGSHSKKYKNSPGALGGGGGGAPNPFRDALTAVPFTVPSTSIVTVSGGGAALAAAVAAAVPGQLIQILDSLTYSEVIIAGCLNLTIEASFGQTPKIQRAAPSHITPGFCLTLRGIIDGFAIRGVTFHGNGNSNTLSTLDDGLLSLRPNSINACTFADRIIVEDCIFSEDGTDNAHSTPGIYFVGTDGTSYLNVWVHRCTFSNNSNAAAATANGYGACTIGGFANVYIQNCEAIRTDAIVTRAASNMRGYVFHNLSTIVEDCLGYDLGTGGSCENFKQVSVFIGTDVAVGPSSVRNCVAYRPHRGYRIDTGGATMTVNECVVDDDLAGVAAGQTLMQQTAGTLVVQNCVMVGAGDGTTFSATVTETYNDVFNFGATGKVLDATDLTIDPLFANVGANNFLATAPAVMTGASDGGAQGVRYPGGEIIFWVVFP